MEKTLTKALCLLPLPEEEVQARPCVLPVTSPGASPSIYFSFSIYFSSCSNLCWTFQL